MKIRKEAWHLKVFLQAYVNDRMWIDGWMGTNDGPLDMPERVARKQFAAELKEKDERAYEIIVCYAYAPKEWTPELREIEAQYRELREAEARAHEAWSKAMLASYYEERKKEVSERLYAGRMSLCPYFWHVVFALVFYYPIVVLVRGAWRKMTSVVPPFEAIYRVAVGVAIIFAAFLVYAGRAIPRQAVTSVKESYANYQANKLIDAQNEAYREAEEAKRAADQEAWEKSHPEDVRRRQEEEAAARRANEAYVAQARAAEWQETKSNFKDGLRFLGSLALIVATGIVVIVAAFFLIGLIVGEIGKLVSAPADAVGRRWSESALRRKLSVWAAAWRTFWADTRQLVAAFLKAKKERVCPFLTIENGQHE